MMGADYTHPLKTSASFAAWEFGKVLTWFYKSFFIYELFIITLGNIEIIKMSVVVKKTQTVGSWQS